MNLKFEIIIKAIHEVEGNYTAHRVEGVVNGERITWPARFCAACGEELPTTPFGKNITSQ